MDTNGLRGAALVIAGLPAYLVAEATGSKTAARVEAWVDGKLGDDADEHPTRTL